MNREGYWRRTKKENVHSELPYPIIGEPWIGQAKFLRSLALQENIARKISYRGFSICRICGEANGSVEFQEEDWTWPEGLRHYVEIHNVRPSLAFQEFVTGDVIQ